MRKIFILYEHNKDSVVIKHESRWKELNISLFSMLGLKTSTAHYTTPPLNIYAIAVDLKYRKSLKMQRNDLKLDLK